MTNHINRTRNSISILLEKSAFNLHAFENRRLNYVNGKIRSQEKLINIPLPPASADKVTFTSVQLSQIVCITPTLSTNPNFEAKPTTSLKLDGVTVLILSTNSNYFTGLPSNITVILPPRTSLYNANPTFAVTNSADTILTPLFAINDKLTKWRALGNDCDPAWKTLIPNIPRFDIHNISKDSINHNRKFHKVELTQRSDSTKETSNTLNLTTNDYSHFDANSTHAQQLIHFHDEPLNTDDSIPIITILEKIIHDERKNNTSVESPLSYN